MSAILYNNQNRDCDNKKAREIYYLIIENI